MDKQKMAERLIFLIAEQCGFEKIEDEEDRQWICNDEEILAFVALITQMYKDTKNGR